MSLLKVLSNYSQKRRFREIGNMRGFYSKGFLPFCLHGSTGDNIVKT
jgi:hypothetical protein